jgi:hypothetical protein
MRCLYCGKELALLKRLTGGGEFCSDAHKQSYQEEYNRLALSRLLQAQKRTEKPEKPEKAEKAEKPNKTQPQEVPAPAPTQAPEPVAVQPPVVEQPVVVEEPVKAAPEPEPVEAAGFILEQPAVVAWQDDALYLEPCSEFSAAPAVVPAWAVDNGVSTLSAAPLVSLQLGPAVSSQELPISESQLTPQEFTNAKTTPDLAWQVIHQHPLPSAHLAAIEIAPRAQEFQTDGILVQAIDFQNTADLQSFTMWELPGTGIDFPADDSDVVIAHWSSNGTLESRFDMAPVSFNAATTAAETWTEPEPTPRTALEALARLHQDLAGLEETAGVAAATLVAEPPEEPEPVEVEAGGPEAASVDAAPEQPEPAPRQAGELLEVAIKTLVPSKPSLMIGEAFASQPSAILPRLKALPLRPKVALAPEFVPEPKPVAAVNLPAEAKAKTTSGNTASRPQVPQKTAPSAKPVPTKAAASKQTSTPGKSAPAAPQSGTAKTIQPKPTPPAPVAKAAEPVQAAKLAPPETVQPAQAAAPSTPPPQAREQEKPAGKSAAEPARKPAEDTAVKAATPMTDDDLPSFGTVQPSTSFLGSLKVKLGIGILLIVVACTTYFGWGNKAHQPFNAATTADGAGPSIIIGEGGWVEGWGSDPSDVHAGRDITIYRPSLKLSDYRLEFQGRIETKSLGWVFRAADPQNYYAMKLMTVSSGLNSKVALFKYLVVNGRQTQVGRVPIELAVQPDTGFNIRVDVRGPQFTTYVQGQQVDVWTDDQLKTGGVGLLNEREERGRVKSVSLHYLNGAGK